MDRAKQIASWLLRIDASRATREISTYLQDSCRRRSSNGVLIGLSGGIDSCLLSALAVRALEPRRVQLRYLYDRNSTAGLARNAENVAQWLGCELRRQSIDEAMQHAGVYRSPGHRVTAVSGLANRALLALYRLGLGETAFLSMLRLGNALSLGERPEALGLRRMVAHPEGMVNARHRYRRQVLEQEAAQRGLTLIGAANRTEWLVGWFVKDGIDDVPIQPIKGLYKTQVRQMAAYLELPGEIITQAPSPDMVDGVTDERGLGLSYARIDLILDHLAGGVGENELSACRISARQIRHVRAMCRLSWWKRLSEGEKAPADGGPGGGLRC